MIKKIFEYYFLVLLRGYDNLFTKDKLYYRVTGLIGVTFGINLFSLLVLFGRNLLFRYTLWVCLGFAILDILIMMILDIIYNKKRRESLREEYKNESYDSRKRGVVKVVVYEILSVLFLIWTFSRFVKFYNP